MYGDKNFLQVSQGNSMNNHLLNKIKQVAFFKNIPTTLLQTLVTHSKILQCKNREMLFHEQESGERFFFLLDGAVKLYKSNDAGKEVTIKMVQPGELFAELIIFEDNKYPVSAMAIKKSEILAIHRDQFRVLLEDTQIRDRFITSLMQRMRYLTQRLKHVQTEDVRTRFLRFLIEKYGIEQQYIIEISKKEIAYSIGTIPETFSRMVKALVAEEKITWVKNELTINDKLLLIGICE